jgi:NADPH-dependent 2,4-dienoyl-CoA reductase/sulfur reductase-like enzyme
MSVRRVGIIGAGQAGFQTAASLRQDGFDGQIALIGDEPGVPYQRPPLSKAYLLGKTSLEALRFRPETYFAEHRIELVHERAVAIDRANRRVKLKSGSSVAYDHLVLAVGAHNRALPVPGANLDGVLGLRTLADADELAVRLKHAREVVVVGAGFIGLEFAAVASTLGASVHVLELADRPMPRAVSVEMSRVFARAHEAWGVRLDFGQALARIHGRDGAVDHVETADGRYLSAQLVVFGIGVLPNVSLASEAGLEIGNCIRVGSNLLTSDPAISAIGDCASFPNPHSGELIRLESVQNATDQARAVSARIVGRPRPYRAVPWFWTEQRDLKLQMAGLSSGYDTAVTLGSPEARSTSVLCFRAGRLVAVESVNCPLDHMIARRVLARTTPALSPIDASASGFDLKAWEAASKTAPRRPAIPSGAELMEPT